jgi:glycosyl transferase family 2
LLELPTPGFVQSRERLATSRRLQKLRNLYGQVRWLASPEFRRSYERLHEGQAQLLRAIEALQDREIENRSRLWTLRAGDAYATAFSEPNPLVSVTIPTYTNYEALAGIALPSALAQTHENIEVVVVGDRAPSETAQVVDSFADPRIRYVNLTDRAPYPEHPRRRWYVAGVPALNEAARLARGSWIAPLNDDDEFTPNHIEVLLAAARRERKEVAYGRFRVVFPDRKPRIGGVYPPVLDEFTWQCAIYHAGLRFFEMELGDAWFDRPGDWSLCRRMLLAGVTFTMVDDVVAHLYRTNAARAELLRRRSATTANLHVE